MKPNGILVLVAHPDDETLTFSSRCRGAVVISVIDGNWLGRGRERAVEFDKACEELGARECRILDVADIYLWSLPHEVLVDRLSSLGNFDCIYTHSPQDDHPHHRNVALAAAQVFGGVRVQARGAVPTEVHALGDEQLKRKTDILNSVYTKELRPPDESYGIPLEAVLGVEAFALISHREALQSLVLNRRVWAGFEKHDPVGGLQRTSSTGIVSFPSVFLNILSCHPLVPLFQHLDDPARLAHGESTQVILAGGVFDEGAQGLFAGAADGARGHGPGRAVRRRRGAIPSGERDREGRQPERQ